MKSGSRRLSAPATRLFQLRTRWRAEAEWHALVAHIDEEEKRDA